MERDFRVQPHKKELQKRRHHEQQQKQEEQKREPMRKIQTIRDQGSITRLLSRLLNGMRDLANLIMTYWPEICSTEPFIKSMELLNLAEIGSSPELQRLTKGIHGHLLNKLDRYDTRLWPRNPEDRFEWSNAFSILLARSRVICCWSNREYVFTTSGHVLMNWTRCFCTDEPCTENCVDRCRGHSLCDCHHWLCGCIDRDVCRKGKHLRQPPWLWRPVDDDKQATSLFGFCEELLYALQVPNEYVVPQTLTFRFVGFCTTTWYPVIEIKYKI